MSIVKKKTHIKGVEVAYTFVRIDEKIPIHRLSLIDMMRAIFMKLNENDYDEQKNQEILSRHTNTLTADLVSFIDKALIPIRLGKKKDVLMRIPSRFEPILEDIVNGDKYQRFYITKISKQRKRFREVKFKYRVFFKLKEEQ